MKTAFFVVSALIFGSTLMAADDLPALKAKVMRADYRADIAELTRLRDEIARRHYDADVVYLARYWSGFASWRIAINGANNGMKGDQLKTSLQNAAADFYAAMRLKPTFADAFAAAAQVNGWLATFYASSDPVTFQERLALYGMLLARATELDADNPRVLWARGGARLFAPTPDVAGAMTFYSKMLLESERRGSHADSPLPDWGRPEALMSMAYAHLEATPPDRALARQEALAALRLVPDWSYVRDKLMKTIDDQQPETVVH
jgi:hypothetical protein